MRWVHRTILTVLCACFVIGLPRGWAAEEQADFQDVTDSAGIRFQHHSPLTRERHLHLSLGSGLAWIDYDGDSFCDLYLCQGASWGDVGTDDSRPSNRFYLNLGDGSFRDITIDAGLLDVDYSMGTAVGDFDNDGFADLYVSAYGQNRLFRNNGDGTFSETTSKAAVGDERFGSSSTWADVDDDGLLDLFVANYLNLPRDNYPICKQTELGETHYYGCPPSHPKHEYDVLYRNNGDGTFSDISRSAGLHSGPARCGLGVISTDLDADGDVDFYVANDTVHNQLWINQGNGTFVDEALLTGVAVNRLGLAEAGMGLASGDVDGDGQPDLFVTNYYTESNTLYRNEGFVFTDVTAEFGLEAPSRLRLAFGASLFDVDNDSWPDLFVANGHVHSEQRKLGRQEPFIQLPQLFLNERGRRFRDISESAGDYFKRRSVGRSSATADFDHDGKVDLAVQHLNSSFTLLRNTTMPAGNSLQLELHGIHGPRDAIGAVVEVSTEERKLVQARQGSSSYLSSSSRTIHIGVGKVDIVDRVLVKWPGGRHEYWTQVEAGKLHRLIEGTGTALE